MTKLPAGDYLFIHYGYTDDSKPVLSLLGDGGTEFMQFAPSGQDFTISFDTSQRYCNGWHDLRTALSYPCPDRAQLPSQYDQCRHCQQKTGFNPAFYHASSVSEQQQARNALPHLLYLAHFAPGVVKVGISWAERGIKRLLDQGARSGLIIKVYPDADIARQYEARIAKLSGIAETLQLRQKYQLLQRPYDATAGATELLLARGRVTEEIGMSPDEHAPLHLDRYYLGNGTTLQAGQLVDVSTNHVLSGSCIGMIGSVLITEQDGLQFSLPLSKYTGYRCTISPDVATNQYKPQQVSLF